METSLRALLNPPTSLSTAQRLGFFLPAGGRASSWVLLELPSELSNLLPAVHERTSRLGQTFFFGTLAFTPVLTRISYICRSPFKLHGFKKFLSYQLSTISPDSWYHSLRTPVPYFVPEGLFLTSDYLRMSKAAIRFASHSFPIFLCTPVFHHPEGPGSLFELSSKRNEDSWSVSFVRAALWADADEYDKYRRIHGWMSRGYVGLSCELTSMHGSPQKNSLPSDGSVRRVIP